MFGTLLLIFCVMAIGMILCFREESGHRTFLSSLIDKLEEHMSK